MNENLVLANFGFFGWITLIVEIGLAGLLIVGYRTKIVALVGAAWVIPIGLSVIYYDRADEWSWSYIPMSTTVIGQMISPLRIGVGSSHALATSQPTTSPTRNGAAVESSPDHAWILVVVAATNTTNAVTDRRRSRRRAGCVR